MTLKRYNSKRNFQKTPEPKGEASSKSKSLRYIIQKHDASHLHYDLRLEMEGVMKSWAIPKGPSLNPNDKRLAMQVEDHPISYNSFEGHIPEGQYGGGDVIVWDKGSYHSLETKNREQSEIEFIDGLKKGRLKLFINGKKLKGRFSLFRFGEKNEWMFVKREDEFVSDEDITIDARSVLSKKMLVGRNEDTTKYINFIKKVKR